MYWPLGAPRVYAAKIPGIGSTYDSDDDGSIIAASPIEEPSEASGKLPETPEGNELSAKPVEVAEDHTERKVKDVVNGNEGLHPGRLEEAGKSGSSLDVTFTDTADEEKKRTHGSRDLLALKMSRNGALFATVTASELTIWQTRVGVHFGLFLAVFGRF